MEPASHRSSGPGGVDRRASPAASAVLVAGTAVVVAASQVPAWRHPLLVATAFASAALIVVAARRLRPRPRWPWLVLAAMFALWGLAVLAPVTAGGPGSAGVLAVAAMATAQLGGAVVGVHLAFAPSRTRWRKPPLVDAAIIVVTLGLVGAQLVMVASDRGTHALTAVTTPSVDVALLVVVVVYAVSRARVVPAVTLGITGACLFLAADLATALTGHRMAPAGDPLQVVALAVGPLFAASALTPSMVDVFDAAQLTLRRTPSSALVRLLPLLAVPPALWAVASLASVRGLPDALLVTAGAVISALCLVRAATALRSTEMMAAHDALTGLPNRHGLEIAHARAADRGRGLVLVDVDDFKSVNDTHGHDVGDLALLAVRDRLRATAGEGALVGRLGGDEFALLVPAARAEQLARDVVDALRSPVSAAGLQLRVRASVGVALPEHATDHAVAETSGGVGDVPGGALSELLTHADVAMYAAKAAGRDQAVTYQPSMREDVTHRFTLSNELRLLLGGPDAAVGYLEVHYQVLVDLVSQDVIGAEALVRWRHPRLGMLAPGAFLELVSASGLDAALDEAVLREVVDQVARWRSQGRTVAPISVNLTRDSLMRADLVELVLTLLVDAGVPASLLHLEITEHEALPDDAAIAERLLELDTAGVRIHLDDYGTGYTSMDYLRRFPVRVLKIDRTVTVTLDEIVGGSDGDGEARCSIPAFRGSIVGGLVAMTDALGIELLAEGVETEQQAITLRALGVRYAQGYLYGRPQPAVEHAVADLSAAPPAAPLPDDVAAVPAVGVRVTRP